MARLDNAIRLKSYQDDLRNQHDIMERQLIQAQKMEVIGLLASGLAHDLNNILGSIVGYTELAGTYASDERHLKDYLRHASESADHAGKLVQQILNLGRMSDVNTSPSDLEEMIGDSVRLLRAAIPDSVAAEWRGTATAVRVNIDPTHIHQVLMNLCTNAVHAMPHGGTIRIGLELVDVDPTRTAELGLTAAGRYAKLSVCDTGSGMDADTLSHIFDPFFTTKPKGKGTGIGLSVVQRIVEHNRGAICAASEPGSGTTFDIFWPLAAQTSETTSDAEKGVTNAGQEAHSVR
jgi:signal transduction histidine kinase